MAEVTFRDKTREQKEDHITHVYELQVSDADNQDTAVRAANRWVENTQAGTTSSARTGTNIEKIGETGGLNPKNIYHIETKIDEFDDKETETSKTDEEWLEESNRQRNPVQGGQRSYDSTPNKTTGREAIRNLSESITDNFKRALRTPSTYTSRIFLKGKINEIGLVSIPKIETEGANMRVPGRYNGAVYSPKMDTPAFMWDARLTDQNLLIIRKEFFDGHNVSRDSINWVQVLLINAPHDPVSELKSMSEEYWFNNMIWKKRLPADDRSSARIVIRQNEWRAVNYHKYDELAVIMLAIDEDNTNPITGKMRFNPDTITRRKNTIEFTVPDRIILRPTFGPDEDGAGQIVQCITQPGRFF